MSEQDTKRGPGQRGQGQREGGFSFGDRRGGRDGDRGGRDGDRRGGRGGREGGGGAAYRVINELSALEKALTKADFGAMKGPLDEVLKALRSVRLGSLEQLDANARGRLITSLMRVMRLPRPRPAEGGGGEPDGATPPAEEAAAAEGQASEETAASPAGETEARSGAAVPAAPRVDPAVQAYLDAQFTIGLIWLAVNERDRAETAFEAAERRPTEAELKVAPPPAASAEQRGGRRGERSERPARGERPPRGERPERGPRRERPERPERRGPPEPFVATGDWQADAARLEQLGRTRDAGRLHEKNQSYADASRLWEAGGDVKAALRAAAAGKLDARIDELKGKVSDAELIDALERAQAWEKLMEVHVGRQDYEAIAGLYERALQFDQAALAYERAGKLSLARKAYERAKDYAAANRVRELEVKKLLERGDRLGAATLLLTVGKKDAAVETVTALPGPKAYSFLQKLKLFPEAKTLARTELAKAEAEGNALHKARWLEALGEWAQAGEVYLAASRKDKAAAAFMEAHEFVRAGQLYEALGNLDKAEAMYIRGKDDANAVRVRALPRPPPGAAPAAAEGEESEGDSLAPGAGDADGDHPAEAATSDGEGAGASTPAPVASDGPGAREGGDPDDAAAVEAGGERDGAGGAPGAAVGSEAAEAGSASGGREGAPEATEASGAESEATGGSAAGAGEAAETGATAGASSAGTAEGPVDPEGAPGDEDRHLSEAGPGPQHGAAPPA